MNAIDELVARSKPHHELQIFREFHRVNPHVLDFLVQEIQLRLDSGFDAFSFWVAVGLRAVEARRAEARGDLQNE